MFLKQGRTIWEKFLICSLIVLHINLIMPLEPLARAEDAQVPSYKWATVEIGEGAEPSLAIDSLGKPHMCFGKDDGNTAQPTHIFYADKEGDTWSVTEIALKPNAITETSVLVDGNNKIHLAYATECGEKVWYRTNKSGSWQEEQIKDHWTGNYESMVMDDNGRFHACYWNNNTWDTADGKQLQLNYKSKDASVTWQSQAVEGLGVSADVTVYAGYPTYKAPTAMAVTHGAVTAPHIIAGINSGKLKHYWKTGTGWTSEIFAYGYELSFDPNGTVQFDYNNVLYCVLIQTVFGAKSLILAKNAGGSWLYETITQLSAGSLGRAALLIDEQNNLHAAFFSGQKLFYGMKDNGTWVFQEAGIIPGGAVPEDISLALDGSGKPRIAYSTSNPKKIYYAEGNISHSNSPPVMEPIPVKSANEGELLTFSVVASDQDTEDTLNYEMEPVVGKNYPEGAVLNSASGVFEWMPTYQQAGYYEAAVTVLDGNGGEDSDVIKITVANVNTKPTTGITSSAFSVTTGTDFTLHITASDIDGDTLTYELKENSTVISTEPLTEITRNKTAAGIYEYIITVTDPDSESATALCSVEVTEPNEDPLDDFPVSGDFNGDGITDVGTFNKKTGSWRIAISDNGNFTGAQVWMSGLKAPDEQYGYSLTGDFNGDGKTDIVLYDIKNAVWKFAFSNGAGFVRDESWDVTQFGGGECSPLVGDFNGDGITDIGYYTPSSRGSHFCIKLAGADRTGFTPVYITGDTGLADSHTYTGDFNGDGLADIAAFSRNSGEWKVLLAGDTTANRYVDFVHAESTTGDTIYDVSGGSRWGSHDSTHDGDLNTSAGGYFYANNGGAAVTITTTFVFSEPVDVTKVLAKAFTYGGGGTGSETRKVYLYKGNDKIDILGNNIDNNLITEISGDWTGITKAELYSRRYQASLREFDCRADNYELQILTPEDKTAAAGAFPAFTDGTAWITDFGSHREPVITDYNHDGKTDIGYFDSNDGKWYYAVSDGTKFNAVSGAQWPSDFGMGSYVLPSGGDYNGDGIGDASIFHRDRQGVLDKWEIKLHNSKQPDLLIAVDSGIGGTTNIGYEVSTSLDNTGGDGKPDLPFPVQVVKKETKSDGMGNSYSVNYEYSDGMFEPDSREFRGFKHVKVIDAEGTVKETEFYQGDVLKGKPRWEEVRDGSGKLYSAVSYEWQESNKIYGGLCDFPYIISQTSTIYNHTAGTSRDVKMVYGEPDDYGNVTRIDELGFVSDPNDDRCTMVEYEYNTAKYIVGKPKHTTIMKSGVKSAETWYRYDSLGSLKEEEKWLNTGEGNPVTKFRYDYEANANNRCGNLVEVEDVLGRKTTTSYGASDKYTFPVSVINALGHVQSFTYERKTGQILTSTDPNNVVTQTIYDNFGRTLKVIGPNDNEGSPSIQYVYDLSVRPVRIMTITKVDTAITTTSYAFMDGLGRTLEVKTDAEDPGEQLISGIVKYDSRGQVKEKYLPYFSTASPDYLAPNYAQLKITYVYDPVGRIVQTIRPDNVSSSAQYDGWIVTATDGNGHKITQEKDAFGRLIKVTEYNNTETYLTQYQYDALGNLVKTIDAQSNETTITYDSLGRKRTMNDPDMGEWSYDYDAPGNLKKQTDAKGQVIEFEYDAVNRLKEKSGQSPAGAVPDFSVTYTYDEPGKPNCIGRLSKVTDSSGTTEFFYDNLGREIKAVKSIPPASYIVSRTYDSIDRLKTVTYPDGEVLTYTYNRAGGVKTVSSPSENYVTNVNYNSNGQMTRIDYGNGTHTEYSYNAQTLRLENLMTDNEQGAVLQNLTYGFDNVGNVLSITDASNAGTNTQSFEYDPLNRLKKATGVSYGVINYNYDSIGNMLQNGDMTMEYGAIAGPHAVTAYTRDSKRYELSYDENGNMLAKGESSGIKQFKYDIENRLAEVSIPREVYLTDYPINLHAGWNFVSIPVIVTDDIDTILEHSGITKAEVVRFNASAQTWEHHTYEAGKDLAQYNDIGFTDFEYGRGYEVYVGSDCALRVTGITPTTPKTFDLKTGWNLIGAPTATSIDAYKALEGVQYTLLMATEGSTAFTYISVNIMEAGKAYFIKVSSNQTWNIAKEEGKTIYTYDGDGGRVKVLTSEETTTYVGSLYEEKFTSRGEHSIVKHIFLGSTRICSADQTLSTVSYHYYHQDHIGSSNVITNESGQLAKLIEYSPYGLTSREEGAYNTDCKFTGKLFDSSTALYYYGARYYDPELGRFIQPDTIVPYPDDPQSFNRYSYCRNNPITYVDPTGHFWWAVIAAVVGAIIGAISAHNAGGNVWAGAAIGAACGYFGAGIANIATSAMGIGIGAGVGTGVGASAAGSWGGSIITPLEGALITGTEFAIGGFAAGLASGYAGGEGSAGDMFAQAGIGAGIGFGSGFATGYSYTTGWQSILHGANTQAHNVNVYYQKASEALSKGQFTQYAQYSRELIKLGVKPPSAVLAGYCRIPNTPADHGYLVGVKEGQITARGFNPKELSAKVLAGVAVPGHVTDEKALLSTSMFKLLTTDIAKVNSVLSNMNIIKMDNYQLFNEAINCYGWRNAVLEASGVAPPNYGAIATH